MSLVRPTLEYASSSWNPHADCNVNRLEQVQKNAARFVCNNFKTCANTSKLVKSLGWKILEQRRLLNQSVLFFQFHNNLPNCNIHRKSRSTRRHQLCYKHLHAYVLSFNYSFYPPRTIRLRNLLPYEVVTSDTLSCFKQYALPTIRSLKAVPPHIISSCQMAKVSNCLLDMYAMRAYFIQLVASCA